LDDAGLAARAQALAAEIRAGIVAHGLVDHPRHGRTYACEVAGPGHHTKMDDANVPSLLAMPFMGFCRADDPLYRATRAFVLSDANPFFYRGAAATGIGSPDMPKDHIWPIALAMQGLTARDRGEKLGLLGRLMATDGGTGLMHESFHKDDRARSTRAWFARANSLFAEFVLDMCEDAAPPP